MDSHAEGRVREAGKREEVVRAYVLSAAELSACRRYRYALWRRWSDGHKTVLFIGLNPSTADAARDDPTVRRCVGFAKHFGFDAMALANLFAFRATKPKALLRASDPIGPANDRWLAQLAQQAELVVAAWGSSCRMSQRGAAVIAMLGNVYCLGTTRAGFPRHPLYLHRDTSLMLLSAYQAPEAGGPRRNEL